VEALLPIDGPEVAAVLGGLSPPPAFAAALRSDLLIALTRSLDLAAALRPHATRLLVHDPAPPPGVHAAEWLAAPVRDLGLDAPLEVPPLVFTAEERRAAEAWASRLPPRFLAIHPGSGSPAKSWPEGRFRALAARLTEGRPWLLVTGPADARARAALRAAPGAVEAHGAPVRVLGALLARCGLFVGSDSGVGHLAAASGAPTLALFGPTDPLTWSPLGPTVDVLRSPDGTMAGLGLAPVEDAARRLREQARSAASGPPSG
jgi:ADP-heptose:LPS heptosyltransferase